MFGGAPRGPPMKGQGAGKPPLLDLPPNLRMMFEPLAPLEFKPPIVRREFSGYNGIALSTSLFEKDPPPKPKSFETPLERRQKSRAKTLQLHKEKVEILVNDWDPHSNMKATENAYLTLFVGRLSYETNDKKLRREFEQYGPIRTIRVVTDLEGKSRGYAFIEFENEADMTNAYRKTNGKKIDGRRVVCDVERGRTVRNWRPMRFGGGLGGRVGRGKKEEDKQPAGAPASSNQGPSERIHAPSTYDRRGGENGRDRSRSRDGRSREHRDRERGGSRERGGQRGYEVGRGSGRDRSRSRDRGGFRDRRDNYGGAPSSMLNKYSSSAFPPSGSAGSSQPPSSSTNPPSNYNNRNGGGGYERRGGRSRSRDRR